MIERTVHDTLNRLVNELPIIAITVPRQSCKKTIAMKAFPNLTCQRTFFRVFRVFRGLKVGATGRSPLLAVKIDQRLSNNEFTRLS